MGMTAAIKLEKIVANTTNVLAIEAATAAQALDFLAPLKTGSRGQKAYAAIRSVCKFVEHDRSLSEDFLRLADLIRSRKLEQILE